MKNMNHLIINAVDESISTLVNLFENRPTLFFTENDLVCCLHRMLYNSLDAIGMGTVKDKNGCPHSLVHCEFPTPFRCDMKNGHFECKSNEVRTTGGRKYRRGHFDIVILNPLFIAKHSYPEIRCQSYSGFCSSVTLLEHEPMVLYGVELVFSRDAIKPSRGKEKDKAVLAFIAGATQDEEKLKAGLQMSGFMQKAAMLAFTKDSPESVTQIIRAGFSENSISRLIAAYSPNVNGN